MNRRSLLIGLGTLGASQPMRCAYMAWYRAAIAANEVPNGIPHGIDNWGRALR